MKPRSIRAKQRDWRAHGSLAAIAPTSVAAAPACQHTIRLLDADTRKPVPGLVRITQSDGKAVPLAGLVSRGTKLPNDCWCLLFDESNGFANSAKP